MNKKLLLMAVIPMFLAGNVFAQVATTKVKTQNPNKVAAQTEKNELELEQARQEFKTRAEEAKAAQAARKAQAKEVATEKAKTVGMKTLEQAIARYDRILTRIENMSVISDERKIELSDQISAQVTTLNDLKEKLGAETSAEGIKSVMAEVKAELRNSVDAVKLLVAAIHATHLDNIIERMNGILEDIVEKGELSVTDLAVASAQLKLDDATKAVDEGDLKGAKKLIVEARLEMIALAKQVRTQLRKNAGMEEEASTTTTTGASEVDGSTTTTTTVPETTTTTLIEEGI